MTTTSELTYLTISELSPLLQKREVSPVEATQAMLDRIQAVDPGINSYVTVTADVALAQAREAEAELATGTVRGPLHGVPFALKDLYSTKGIRTTAHSKILLDWIPEADSTATRQLREAGTVLLGKLAMHEFAFGAPGFDTPFPPARNPWNPEHVTGGSSSGSGAALAAGLCYGSLGSDTGGSIRGPAALCGITGLKPTYGRTSRAGVVPLSWSLDHVGPMARSAADCALILQAIAGYDPSDPASADVPVADYSAGLGKGVSGLRIGVPRTWLDENEGCSPELVASFDTAVGVLESLGAKVTTVDATPFIAARNANTLIMIAEAYSYHEETLRTRAQDLSEGVRNRVREGAFISGPDYVFAQRARAVIRAQVQGILHEVDLIASPAWPQEAEAFAKLDPDLRYRQPTFQAPFNLTGLPAISVPCGFSGSGLPFGLQLAGRAFEEATVLQAAQAYEAATDWHTRHPDI